MREANLCTPSGNIRYWVGGHGDECIAFAHGAAMDHGLFVHQVEHFRHSHRVLVWDAPAHGQSRPYTGFSLDDAAVQLAAILDAEHIGTTHLVGQSMGGYIAQVFARKYPDRVRSITAIGSSPLQHSYYSRLDRWLLSIAPGLLKLTPHGLLVKAIADQVTVAPAARDYAFDTLQTYSVQEISSIMGSVYRAVMAFGDDALCPPALLIVYGEKEKTGKVRDYCERWSQAEDWPLEVIPDAAHNCNMDNPGAFNRVLDEFLARL